MELQEIQQSLAQKGNAAEALNSLGSLLREESWRNNDEVKPLITEALGLLGTDEIIDLEVLRVLVNFTADNDENRRILAGEEGFWDWVAGALEKPGSVSERTLILMTQFIHNVNEADAPAFTALLGDFRESLVELVGQEVSEQAVEILSELSEKVLWETSQEEATQLVNQMKDEFEEFDEELQLYFSLLFFKLTKSDTLQFDPHATLGLFDKVAQGDDTSRIKRYLFAGHGNIFSQPSYDNWANVEKSIDFSVGEADPYAASAVAIDIGNCVKSENDQNRLIALIDEKVGLQTFIMALLGRPFSDVVQYQCIHCFTNILQPHTAALILQNWHHLGRMVKAVLDNAQFYPEIAALMSKFSKKLAKSVETGPEHKELWRLFAEGAAEEVLLSLLQNEKALSLVDDEILQPAFLKALFRVPQQVDVMVLLDQLRAQAVFLHGTAPEQFSSALTESYTEFFTSLSAALLDHKDGPGWNVVANNAKFVAASGAKYFESSQEAVAISQDFVRTINSA